MTKEQNTRDFSNVFLLTGFLKTHSNRKERKRETSDSWILNVIINFQLKFKESSQDGNSKFQLPIFFNARERDPLVTRNGWHCKRYFYARISVQ